MTGALDRLDQCGFLDRFEQVISGTQAANTLGIAGFIVTGDDNDRHCDVHGSYRLKHIETRCSGHMKVKQHAVWPIRLDSFQKVVAGLKRLDIITMSFEQTRQRAAHLRFIIHNRDDFVAVRHSDMTMTGHAPLRQLYLS